MIKTTNLIFFSLLELMTLFAKKIGCYKTTLTCPEELVEFCGNADFIEEAQQNFMLSIIKNPDEVMINNDP